MTKSRVVLRGHEGKLRIKEKVTGTLAVGTAATGLSYHYAITSVSSAGVEDACDIAKDVTVTPTEIGAAQVTWSPVSGAKEYRVYRKKSAVAPTNATDYNNKRIATIPGSAGGLFIDDGSYTSATGSQGAGANTPTAYGAICQPQTRMSTSYAEVAFQEISLSQDEGVNEYTHGGVRDATIKEGPLKIKGSIKRMRTDGRWKGAVDGSDKVGTTNTTIAYTNVITGDGRGYYDGTTYTAATGYTSPLPRTKPSFEIEIVDDRNRNIPITFTVTPAMFTSYETSTGGDNAVIETVGFIGETTYSQYAAADSQS